MALPAWANRDLAHRTVRAIKNVPSLSDLQELLRPPPDPSRQEAAWDNLGWKGYRYVGSECDERWKDSVWVPSYPLNRWKALIVDPETRGQTPHALLIHAQYWPERESLTGFMRSSSFFTYPVQSIMQTDESWESIETIGDSYQLTITRLNPVSTRGGISYGFSPRFVHPRLRTTPMSSLAWVVLKRITPDSPWWVVRDITPGEVREYGRGSDLYEAGRQLAQWMTINFLVKGEERSEGCLTQWKELGITLESWHETENLKKLGWIL